jgi:hypothetical protein
MSPNTRFPKANIGISGNAPPSHRHLLNKLIKSDLILEITEKGIGLILG